MECAVRIVAASRTATASAAATNCVRAGCAGVALIGEHCESTPTVSPEIGIDADHDCASVTGEELQESARSPDCRARTDVKASPERLLVREETLATGSANSVRVRNR